MGIRNSGASKNGAIVGESTAQNPSGNSYLVYRDMVAKDFTLKFEIKVEGSGGSGFQYRSKTGMPWLAPYCAQCDGQRGSGEFELDDDRTAGGFLAEFARLDGAVLFGEHADADSGVARAGGGRLGAGEESN